MGYFTSSYNDSSNLISKSTYYPNSKLMSCIDFCISNDNRLIVYELQNLLGSRINKSSIDYLLKENKKTFYYSPKSLFSNALPEHLDVFASNDSVIAGGYPTVEDIIEDAPKVKSSITHGEPINFYIDTHNTFDIHSTYRFEQENYPALQWINTGKSFLDLLLQCKPLQRYIINLIEPDLNPPFFLYSLDDIDNQELIQNKIATLKLKSSDMVVIKGDGTRGQANIFCKADEIEQSLKSLAAHKHQSTKCVSIEKAVGSIPTADSKTGQLQYETGRLSACVEGEAVRLCSTWTDKHPTFDSHHKAKVRKEETSQYHNKALENLLGVLPKINPYALIRKLTQEQDKVHTVLAQKILDRMKDMHKLHKSYAEENNCPADFLRQEEQLLNRASLEIEQALLNIRLIKLKQNTTKAKEEQAMKQSKNNLLAEIEESLEIFLEKIAYAYGANSIEYQTADTFKSDIKFHLHSRIEKARSSVESPTFRKSLMNDIIFKAEVSFKRLKHKPTFEKLIDLLKDIIMVALFPISGFHFARQNYKLQGYYFFNQKPNQLINATEELANKLSLTNQALT